MRVLSRDDLIDLAHGATFLGTGGGGTLASTLQMIERFASPQMALRLLEVDEAIRPAEDRKGVTTVASFIGSQAANESLTDVTPAIRAVEAMSALTQKRLGVPVARTIAIELGVQSSAVPSLLVADQLGLDAVDADGAGRAVPVLPATVFAGAGLSAAPTILTSAGGCTVTVEDDDAMVTNLVAGGVLRSPPFGVVAGLALWPMRAAELQRAVPEHGGTRGSISLSIEVGSALRRGRIESALEAIRRHGLEARILFRGRLVERRTTQSDDHVIATFEDGSGRRVTTYSVSENLVLWDRQSGEPLLLAPDSLCYASPDGQALSNTELPDLGGEVVLVAIEARRVLRESPTIMAAFADYLEKVGYPGPWRPFQELERRRR